MLQAISRFGAGLSTLFGEASSMKTPLKETLFEGHPLSHVLPYVAYDPTNGLFSGSSTLGFAIESIPLVGGDESLQKQILSLFQEDLSEGHSIQCLLWADPRCDPYLQAWRTKRNTSDPLLREIAAKRVEYFEKIRVSSPRLYRFIFSYSAPVEAQRYDQQIAALKAKKEKILKLMKSLSYSWCWTPQDFLDTIGGLLNVSQKGTLQKRQWNKHETLSNQLTTGGKLSIEETGLKWQTDTETLFKSYRVVDFPDEWSLQQMSQLIGDPFRDAYRIDTPFYLHYGVHCPSSSKVEGEFWRRSQVIEKQGRSSSLVRMIPKLAEELQECDHVRRKLHQGERFVWTQLSAGIWGEATKINSAEQALKSLFRIHHFSLAENRCVHFPQYLATLPMTWAEYAPALKNLNLLRTTLTTETANFVPIQGEWMGTPSPGMLMVGRRGQLLNWNPFDNPSGNYNISVVGRSGSGKSVFMQDLLLNGLSTGARVFILDVGRSYEKMCSLVGGQHIQFTKDSQLCLNPFSHVSLQDEEARHDDFSCIKAIVAMMAKPLEGTTDYENALIQDAIKGCWQQKGCNSTISDVSYWLKDQNDESAKCLGLMLSPFGKDGIYGKYFEGKNNVNFTNPCVLIELEELKEKKDLQSVILQLFIMAITSLAFFGDRKTPFYICIDEAWDLLRGKQTGVFIETLARRLRKYNGSLVVGTQTLEDFFATPGALAAYQNSDWQCMLSQKTGLLRRLAADKKIDFDEGMITALESVSTRHGEYSEVMIVDANRNYSIARLMLDPFSLFLYSTKAEDYAHIKHLTSTGLSLIDAIQTMVKRHER